MHNLDNLLIFQASYEKKRHLKQKNCFKMNLRMKKSGLLEHLTVKIHFSLFFLKKKIYTRNFSKLKEFFFYCCYYKLFLSHENFSLIKTLQDKQCKCFDYHTLKDTLRTQMIKIEHVKCSFVCSLFPTLTA